MERRPLLKKLLFALLFIVVWAGSSFAQTNAWINEIHYDNTGTDANETIEIVIETPGTLSDYTLYAYNGANGQIIGTPVTVNNFTVGATVGNFTVYTYDYTTNNSSLQNGPDGIALAYDADGDGIFTLIPGQFLSYEGVLTATEGPATGITSVDIGVSESGSNPVGQSLQLSGSGGIYSAFAWQPSAASTFGSVNTGQTLTGGGNTVPFIFNVTQSPTCKGYAPGGLKTINFIMKTKISHIENVSTEDEIPPGA